MAKVFANSGDPDQTPHSAASDLGLHCLPIILLEVSGLQWLNGSNIFGTMEIYSRHGFKPLRVNHIDRSVGKWG